MPISLFFFAATAVVYLLQVIPVTGIFMMFLLAPLWSVFLVNAGFIGIGIEAAIGMVSRVWLLAPLLWFGGYSIVAHQSRAAFEDLEAEIAKANVGQSLPFDTKRDQIVVESRGWSSDGAAQALVAQYDIPLVYGVWDDHSGYKHRAYHAAAGAVCTDLRAKLNGRYDINISVSDYFEDRRKIESLCLYHNPADPTGPVFRAAFKTSKEVRDLLSFEKFEASVTAPNGQQARQVSAIAHVLAKFPTPVMGCFLNSGAASWQCTTGFERSRESIGTPLDGGSFAAGQIAQMLGIKRAVAATRFASLSTAPPTVAAKAFEDVEKVALRKLDEMLEGGGQRYILFDVEPLRTKPDLWRGRIDRMADYYAANANRRDTGKGIPEALETMFEYMPPADFLRIAPRLAEALRQRPVEDCDFGRKTVLGRIGDLGAAAMPALEAQARVVKGRYCTPLLESICRVGPAAKALTQGVQHAYQNSGHHTASHVHGIAHKALLRMGRRDLAEAYNTKGSPREMQRFEKERATITPASPGSVCG